MDIDERIQALTINLELLTHDVEALRVKSGKDGENIAALAQLMSDQYQMIGGLTMRMDQLAQTAEDALKIASETSLVVKQHNLSIWDIAETNKMLARIISKHEDRLDVLEKKMGVA
ncbi:MAG: hypothetical protein HY820_38830 [Acidobacteria bacterium]|nr:hypothetical protein [Acidobacteriota bacterium]